MHHAPMQQPPTIQLTADPQLLSTAPAATPIYPRLSAHDGHRPYSVSYAFIFQLLLSPMSALYSLASVVNDCGVLLCELCEQSRAGRANCRRYSTNSCCSRGILTEVSSDGKAMLARQTVCSSSVLSNMRLAITRLYYKNLAYT